jgi:hypothetical protein
MPKLSFLTDDAEYTASLTDQIDPEPALGTVVALGGVAREMVYRPKAHYADPDTYGWEPVTSMQRDGVAISVYRRPAIVTALHIVWRLPRGYLTTFVDEQEPGMAGIRELANHVKIGARGSSMPKIRFEPPLAIGDQSDPVNRDSVIFFVANPQSGQPDQCRFYLERRGARSGRAIRRSDGACDAMVTERGVTVSLVAAPANTDAAETHAQSIADTVEPV